MSTDSETKFLISILWTHKYYPLSKQDCAQLLDNLCQNDYPTFLKICYDLIKLIIPIVLRPIQSLPNDVLEAIASDLYQILVPLWGLQMHNDLVNQILNAQNMVSNASNEKNKTSRGKYMKVCYNSLNNAFMYINSILAEKT